MGVAKNVAQNSIIVAGTGADGDGVNGGAAQQCRGLGCIMCKLIGAQTLLKVLACISYNRLAM